MRRMSRTLAAAAALILLAAGCGGSDDDGGGGGSGDSGPTKVKLQLQWVTQAQFAGYFAAVDQGYFRDEGLDVQILEGGVDIVPQTVVGQVFQRSGTLQVSFKDKGIDGPADLRGKKVGNWGFGNEFELFAGMTNAGLDPAKDVTLVQQQFDMLALLKGDIDAAQAMTYNEYAQVLEAKNPRTGKLYQPTDFTALSWNDVGTAMLQDAVWARTERLESEPAYQDTTVKFLTGALKGWAFCRDNAEK